VKKCAKCDAEYDDAYDACPACAKGDEFANAGKVVGGCGTTMIALGMLIFLFLCVLSTCSR
jgi:hypothetical protein